MKTTLLCGLLLASPLLVLAQQDLTNDPAYLRIDEHLDLTRVKPQVNVNLPRFLLMNAVSDLGNKPNDPFTAAGINVAEILKDVKLIRVVIIESDAATRDYVHSAVAALRQDLVKKWTSIVSIPEENIGIYAQGDPSGEKLGGLAVLIADDGDVIIGNIVGNLPLSKLLTVAGQLNGPNGNLIRQALSGFTGQAQAGASTPANPDAPKSETAPQ